MRTEKDFKVEHNLVENQSMASSTSNMSIDAESRLRVIRMQSMKLIERHHNSQKNSFELKYSLGEKIGEGQHSSVFKCFSKVNPLIPLAVKLTREDDEEKKRVIRQEYELTKNLNHQNLLKSVDYFENEANGEIHLVMSYVQGEELAHRLKAGPLSAEDSVKIMKQVLNAVCYLHEDLRIVHRDIKPSNVILADDGHAFLIDFNVSRRVEPGALMMTRTGTPHFNAPEVYSGKPYNEKVDIWSVGVCLFLMMT